MEDFKEVIVTGHQCLLDGKREVGGTAEESISFTLLNDDIIASDALRDGAVISFKVTANDVGRLEVFAAAKRIVNEAFETGYMRTWTEVFLLGPLFAGELGGSGPSSEIKITFAAKKGEYVISDVAVFYKKVFSVPV